MAEQATINLNVKTDESQKSLRAMRQELKQLQIAMDNAADPAEFKRLATQFAELRNDIGDTSQAMKYMDPGELLSGWTKFAQGAVGAFSAITGAMSLFGSESEAIQEIEKKSMVLIQTMMGLEQARQLLVDGGGRAQLKQLFETTAAQYRQVAASVAQWTAQKALNASTVAGSVAFKGLGLAMKAVPFVAVAGAVIGIVAGLANMGKKSDEAAEKTNYMADTLKDAASGASDAMSKVDLYSRRLVNATGSKEKFAKAVKDYNENVGSKYNTSLLTTASNLDDIARAAKEARANIWNMAVVEAGQAKMKQIWSENFDALMAYNQAQENASNLVEQLDAAQKAYDDKWKGVVYDPWQDARGEEQQKDMEVIATLQARILNLQEKGVDAANAAGTAQSDLFKQGLVAQAQIESLLETIDKATSNITVSVNKPTAAIKDATDATKKLKEEFEEPIEFTISVDNGPQQITEAINRMKKEWKAAHDEMMASSLARALQGETWDVVKEKMLDYYGQGVIGEEEYNAAVIEYAAMNSKANEEAYDQGLITVEEYEKNKTAITKAESEKRLEALEKEFSAWTDFANSAASSMGDVFSNLTEMAQMELDAQDKAWNDSWDARYGKMDESMKRVAEIYGTDSMEYKQALKEKEDADGLKADHDALMEKRRKDADNKYKKGSIATDMVKATAEFAKASFGIWAGETSTKGLMGIPIAIALQAMLAAAYGTQMGVMAKQMSLVGKMRLGGPVFGPSHESGGVDRNLEGGEFVINAQSMKVPGVAQLANSLNRAGSAGSVPSVVDEASVRAIVNETVGAIAAIPVVVSERDITGTQRRVAVIESKTSF